jgi:hypothetical protein
MELDQILKRVQWMDDERRKDKDTITKLENRILALEGTDKRREPAGERT